MEPESNPVECEREKHCSYDTMFRCMYASIAIVNTVLFLVLTSSATHFFTRNS